MASTIKLKRGSGAPSGGSLAAGEPALDLTNNKLYSSTDGTDVVEIGFDGQFEDGSVSAPSITFSADTNTGLFRLTSGTIVITGDGVPCMHIMQNSTAFTDNGYLTSTSNGGVEILKNSVAGGILTQSSSTTDYNAALFRNSSGTQGTIVVSASATAYNTSSDYRLKENVITIDNAVARIDNLNPVRFNFISNPSQTVDGFLAHEVAAVVPEAITGEKDAVDEDGNPVYQGIDQAKLVPLLVAAVQELSARVSALEAN